MKKPVKGAKSPDKLGERLALSGLTIKDSAVLKLKPLAPIQTKNLQPHFRELAAFQIPYFDIKGKGAQFYRVRYLEKPKLFGKEMSDFRKYDQPAEMLPTFYLPPLVDWEDVAGDASISIALTEGELKAACACKYALPTIGLGGVYAWKSKKRQLSALPDFDRFDWKERRVYVVFDSDLTTNVMVQTALYDLCVLLVRLGAQPDVVRLPPGPGGAKIGLDDYLVAHGADALAALFTDAEAFTLGTELWRLNQEVVLVENISTVLQRSNHLLLKPSIFTEVNYADRQYTDFRGEKPIQIQAAKAWLKWPYRALVRDVVYEPGISGPTDDGNYSIWPGWGAAPAKGDVTPWKEMMEFVFGKNIEARRWFERWCAIQVQRPGVKMHTAAVLWSPEEGTGKSLIGETLIRIFGKNGIEITYHQLMNAKNAWAQHKQFVMGSEITGSDHRAVADLIKNLITQSAVTIDEKYVPIYTVRDTINYYFTSNHPNAFYISDLDRRFFIWRVPPPREYAFYIRFRDWKNGDGPAALHSYLLGVDLGEFDDKERAMVTDHHSEMVDAGRSDLDAWVYQLKMEPDQALKMLPAGCEKAELFTTTQLKTLYEQARGVVNRITAQGMGLALIRSNVHRVHAGKPIRTKIGLVKLFAVRNGERWAKASPRAAAEHYDQYFGGF